MTVIKPEMINEHITRYDVLPLSFLKKSAYTGSKSGLRYRMEKTVVTVPPPAQDTDKAANETGNGATDKANADITRIAVNAIVSAGNSKTENAETAEAGSSAKATDNANADDAVKSEKDNAAGMVQSEKTVLRVWHWGGCFAFDHTDPAEMTIRDFEFSDAGIDAAIAYLNEVLDKNYSAPCTPYSPR